MNKTIFCLVWGWLWVVSVIMCAILVLFAASIGLCAIIFESVMTFIEKKYYAQFT